LPLTPPDDLTNPLFFIGKVVIVASPPVTVKRNQNKKKAEMEVGYMPGKNNVSRRQVGIILELYL
jgi:hypothetical protein